MKKKISILGLLLLLGFILSACGDKEPKYALVDPPDQSQKDPEPAQKQKKSDNKNKKNDKKKENRTTRELLVFEEEDFEIQELEDESLAVGQRLIVQEGKKGQSEITYELVLVNGKEISRKAVKERIIVRAQPEIVHIGIAEERDEEIGQPAPLPSNDYSTGGAEVVEKPVYTEDLPASSDESYSPQPPSSEEKPPVSNEEPPVSSEEPPVSSEEDPPIDPIDGSSSELPTSGEEESSVVNP